MDKIQNARTDGQCKQSNGNSKKVPKRNAKIKNTV